MLKWARISFNASLQSAAAPDGGGSSAPVAPSAALHASAQRGSAKRTIILRKVSIAESGVVRSVGATRLLFVSSTARSPATSAL